jgi:hypothetical protein
MEVNLVFSLAPMPSTTPMIASEMPAAIKTIFDGCRAGFVSQKNQDQSH